MACSVKIGIHYNRDGTKWMGTMVCEGTCSDNDDDKCVKQEVDGTETLADGTTKDVKITMCVCPERFSTECTTWLVEDVAPDGARVNPRAACGGDCEKGMECIPVEVAIEYFPPEHEGTVKPKVGGRGGNVYPVPAQERKVVKTRWFSCECLCEIV